MKRQKSYEVNRLMFTGSEAQTVVQRADPGQTKLRLQVSR